MKVIEVRGGSPGLGPVSGLLQVMVGEIWIALKETKMGSASLAQMKLKQKLIRLAEWLKNNRFWEDYEIGLDASTQDPDNPDSLGIRVFVRLPGSGLDSWGGLLTFWIEDGTLCLSHISYGN